MNPRDIIKLAREHQRKVKAANQYIVQLSELDSWEFLGYCMKIDPNLEAFFVAIALQHGTHPMPRFGIERTKLAREITEIMATHEGQPGVLGQVRKNYRELGGKLLDTDPNWFYTKLADAYLNWLYEQDESKNLMAEALDGLDESARQTAREGRGIAQKKISHWKI
jgi:hypothetical protein